MDCPAINNRNEGFIAFVGRVVAGQSGIIEEEEKRRGVSTTDDHYVAIRIVDRARSPCLTRTRRVRILSSLIKLKLSRLRSRVNIADLADLADLADRRAYLFLSDRAEFR